MVLIDARELRYAYARGGDALANVSLAIDARERVALVGANGAGKSTLLLLLAGILKPREGRIDSAAPLRELTGTLLQNPEDQIFAATVELDIAFGLVQRGTERDEALRQARAIANRLGIAHLCERGVAALSLGEKKRVALGGVLALRPRVLLLDEPTAGLDANGVEAMLALLDELNNDGTAIVVSTHDTTLAARWAERVVVMERGRILCDGDARAALGDQSILDAAHLATPAPLTAARAMVAALGRDTINATLPMMDDELRRFAIELLRSDLNERAE